MALRNTTALPTFVNLSSAVPKQACDQDTLREDVFDKWYAELPNKRDLGTVTRVRKRHTAGGPCHRDRQTLAPHQRQDASLYPAAASRPRWTRSLRVFMNIRSAVCGILHFRQEMTREQAIVHNLFGDASDHP